MTQETPIIDRVAIALGVKKTDIARIFGVSKGAVNNWRHDGIPSTYCHKIEKMLKKTDDPLTRKDMRPDDWQNWWPELKQSKSKVTDV